MTADYTIELTDGQKKMIPMLFTMRDVDFMDASLDYQNGKAPGFPAHNLILIIANLCRLFQVDVEELREIISAYDLSIIKEAPDPPDPKTTLIRMGGLGKVL